MQTILCYGDSNTWGSIPNQDGRYPYDVRWPGVMQKMLGENYLVIEEGCSGRTTVWDDPVEDNKGDKNGKRYLRPCLYSHHPIDLVILMLGTNDLKPRFSVSAFDIGESAGELVEIIQRFGCGPGGGAPEVLLVAPVPILETGKWAEMLCGGREKSLKLAHYYQEKAKELGVEFMDTAPLVQVSPADGIHLEAASQIKLGEAFAARVKQIL